MKKLLTLLVISVLTTTSCSPMEPEDNMRRDEAHTILSDLTNACIHNNAQKVQEIYAEGIPPAVVSYEKSLYHTDVTFLTFALQRGSNAVARVLIDKGASLEPRGIMPALHGAVVVGNSEGTHMLIEAYGCSANAEYNGGHTPLHMLCDYKQANTAAVAELLLKAGAFIDARNANLWTPLHMAIKSRHINALRICLTRCMPHRNTAMAIPVETKPEEQAEQSEELPAPEIKTLKQIALEWLDAHYRECDQSALSAVFHTLHEELYERFIEHPQFVQLLERDQQVTFLIKCCQAHLDFIKSIVAMRCCNTKIGCFQTARDMAQTDKEMTAIGPEDTAILDKIIELLDRVTNAKAFQDLGDFGLDIIKHYAEHYGIWPIELEDFPAPQRDAQIETALIGWLPFLIERSGI